MASGSSGISPTDEVNEEIKSIVEEAKNDGSLDASKFSWKVPLLYKNLDKKDLLFIGLNPSLEGNKLKNRLGSVKNNLDQIHYPDKDTLNKLIASIEDVVKNAGSNGLDEQEIDWEGLAEYLHKSFSNKDSEWIKDELLKLEQFVSKGGFKTDNQYNYFQSIDKFTSRLSESFRWNHVDMIPLRSQSEDSLGKLIYTSNITNSNLTKKFAGIIPKIIRRVNPKAIFVINAKASKVFDQQLQPIVESFDEYGCYWYNEKPVFYSGMLSGARTLDNGSMERLEWHARFVLKSLGSLK